MGKQLLNWLLGWIFPLRCLGCKRYDTWLCSDCLPAHPPLLTNGIYALGYYQDKTLQLAIHHLKYNSYPGLATPLGSALAQRIPVDSYDMVVPVPLHWRRHWQRGYNQTALIASQFPKPVWPALRKVRATASQAKLNRLERQHNLQDAFAVPTWLQPELLGKRVLLIDDVYSTGSTTAACTKALLGAGVHSVQIGVVALNM